MQQKGVIIIKLIFFGMIFVFLNFEINLGNISVGLIPSFLGYFFMYKGLLELMNYNSYFERLMAFVRGMIIYTAILYLVDLLGIMPYFAVPLLALISVGLALYIAYNIIMGIKEIEASQNRNLNTQQLYFAWKLQAVFSFLPIVTGFLPLLAIAAIMLGFVVGVYFLYMFYNTMSLFYSVEY